MSLFVGNLSRNAKQKDLETAFRRYGDCRVQMKEGYAFVVYGVVRDAESALNALCGKPLCDELPRITWSKRQPLSAAGARDPATAQLIGSEYAPRWIHSKDQALPFWTGGEGRGIDGFGSTGVWPPQVHPSSGKMEGPTDLTATEEIHQVCSTYPDPARSGAVQLKAKIFSSGSSFAHRQESSTGRGRREVPEPGLLDVSPECQSNAPSGRCEKPLSSPTNAKVIQSGPSHSRHKQMTGHVSSNGGDSEVSRGPDVQCSRSWPNRDPSWNGKLCRDVPDQRGASGNRETIADEGIDTVDWKDQEKGEYNRTSYGGSMRHTSTDFGKHTSKETARRHSKKVERFDTVVRDGTQFKGTTQSHERAGAIQPSVCCMKFPMAGSRGRVAGGGTVRKSHASTSRRRSSSRSSRSQPDRTSGSGSRSEAQEVSARSRQSSSASFSESKSFSRSPPCSQKSASASPGTRSRSYSPASISLARSESQVSASPPERQKSATAVVNRYSPAEIAPRSVSQSPQAAGRTRHVPRYTEGQSEKAATGSNIRGDDKQEIAASKSERRGEPRPGPVSAGQILPSISGKREERELVRDNLDTKVENGEYRAVKRFKGNGRSATGVKNNVRTYDCQRRSKQREAERNAIGEDQEGGYAPDDYLLTNSRGEQGGTGVEGSPRDYPDRVAREYNGSCGQKSDQESGEISGEPLVQETEVASSDENHGATRRNSRTKTEMLDFQVREPEGTLFGAARFWPWEVILARRHRRGAISIENFERRKAQNAAHLIVDKYVRSSSGWWERDCNGRLLSE